MDEKLWVLRIIHAALLFSCLLYVPIGEVVASKEPRDVRFLFIGLAIGGLSTLTLAMRLRPRLVGSAEETLRHNPDDAAALARWQTAQIVLYGMCEAVALYGLVLRMLGTPLIQVLPFYGGAVLLMLMWMPRRPE